MVINLDSWWLVEIFLTYSSKFLGVGISETIFREISPEVPSRLWAELDVVPMVFRSSFNYPDTAPEQQRVDEQADSMARKCLMYYLLFHPVMAFY